MTERVCHSEEDGTSDVRISIVLGKVLHAKPMPSAMILPRRLWLLGVIITDVETPTVGHALPRSDRLCHFERRREICTRLFPLSCLSVVSMSPATSFPYVSHSFDMTGRYRHSEEDGTSDVRISILGSRVCLENALPSRETPTSQSLPAPRSDNSEEIPTSPLAPRSDNYRCRDSHGWACPPSE